MARPNQDAIDTFISITGASEAVALQKLEEHGGDLNEAVNAHFSEGDRNRLHPTSIPAPQNDFMDIDDNTIQVENQGPIPLLSAARNLNPFSLLDPNFRRSFFEGRVAGEFASGAPWVSHPREVRGIPIDFKDENDQSGHSVSRPTTGEFASGAPWVSHPREVREIPIEFKDENDQSGHSVSRPTTGEFASGAPWVSHPREVKEIPIEFKDENDQSGHSVSRPTIEDVTGTTHEHGPEIRGNVIIDDEEDEDIPNAPTAHAAAHNEREGGISVDSLHGRHSRPSAPELDSVTDHANDIEEEMLQAAIEASKREVEEGYRNQHFGAPNDSGPRLQQRQSHLEDAELARAVSLSLKTAEQEKTLREGGLVGTAGKGVSNPSDVEEQGKLSVENDRQGFGSFNKGTSSQVKLEVGSSSIQDEAEDVEEQPLVRHRSRRVSSGSVVSAEEVGEMVDSPPSSPGQHDIGRHPQHNGDAFHSDEWGGISSEEHDEAVMLEAALFGGIPEGTAYRFAYGSDRNAGPYPRQEPRPPSPTLTAQRLLREQQDDEYLASLQADREKELKAMEEAEARRSEEQAAREAALEEQRRKEEESQKKLLEEKEFQRQLAVKEASLPQEPPSDDENAVTLLVRMPDGSRRGRRFLKSDKLQSLFDFIDVGRGVKPGTYRLVRPYPRRAFSEGEIGLSLSELGLGSKQEALFLELI